MIKELFPFKFGDLDHDKYSLDVDWHEVAEALRHQQFDLIGPYGLELIADRIDPEIKRKSGRPSRSLDFISTVYWTFEHLRRKGYSYKEALEETTYQLKDHDISEKNVEAIVLEYKQILKDHHKRVLEQQQRLAEIGVKIQIDPPPTKLP